MNEQNSPVYGEITGLSVMIGFGSIGRGTLPLIERHFKFDKIAHDGHRSPSDADRKPARGARHRLRPGSVTQDNYKKLLKPLLTEGRRPGLLRQPLGRHRLARSDEALPQARRALHRHRRRAVARLLFRRQGGQCRAHQLRAARDRARREARRTRRPDGGFLLRRQSRHGVVVRQAGAGQPRHRPRHGVRGARAGRPRRLGQADEEGRRQGHPHRRARHPAHQEAEAAQRVLEHLVGRGLHLGRPAAGRTRLGHA